MAPGAVTVRDAGLRGMITLRGDLDDPDLRKICTEITGQDMPSIGKISTSGDHALCWMSPDELLLLVPYDHVLSAVARIDAALSGRHYLAENVSDARALIHVEGDYAREVIAKLAPVDLHPAQFGAGDFRRSRLAQVPAAFWMVDQTTFAVICFRSVAEYAFDVLAASAKAGRVGVF